MNWLQNNTDIFNELTKYDTDISRRKMQTEYGWLMRFGCLHPKLETNFNKFIAVIQYILYLSMLLLNMFALCGTLVITVNDATTIAIQTVHFIMLDFIAIALQVCHNAARPELSRNHHYFGENKEYYDAETRATVDKLKILGDKYQKIFSQGSLWFVGLGGLAIVSVGPITGLLTGNFNNNVNGVIMDLPWPSWSPFGNETLTSYFLILSVQGASHFVCVWNVLAANVLYLATTKYLYIELILLNNSIRRLPDRSLNLYQTIYGKSFDGNIYDKIEDPKFQQCYNECLVESVKHHQQIIKAFKDFTRTTNTILFIFFFTSTASIAMSGLLLMHGDGKITTSLNALALGIAEVFDVYLICWCGKMLGDSSEDLYYTLYKTRWFNCNKESAKILLIMMINTKTPLKLYFNRVTKLGANLETFTNLMNTSYSYFNLLFALREE